MASHNTVLLKTDIPYLKLHNKGKVREIFEIDNNLLLVATDRISAFDYILPNGIPNKGKVLTLMSEFWFNFTRELTENHLITTSIDEIDKIIKEDMEMLRGRSMLVKKVEVIPIECIVRGYLAGSGWKEYKENGTVCKMKLPDNLKESDKLPEPIFTPSTKAESGHDENISFEEAVKIAGRELSEEVRQKSIAIYKKASEYALTKGIIISDTKFEWGKYEDKIILIDEVLTPDSSRFWPLESYSPGKPQPSFDKQFVRDHLEQSGWDKQSSPPSLPEEVIRITSEKYLEAYAKLTGEKIPE
ncbi:phosphoribosylaminoimidazole-succinocarboxamide synthase [Candidatus Scalindua japonica]|uniref:Phosphoribosylaminoimidazole-succinocarboxamide synthase n=1 Tax=Candidatus Scalindua japonica TaxID=1284222 RepID=A0A286U274_9BACT|nr:phosphoribosylaminoimidazolesuccinocarboxamide synthase [Candidatus Scalindua japonica]GAX62240.1 phosphoribosylaminoimidazole-succinocarboxamide synthase [Candidatus Scalindua japonica]